MPAEDAGQGQGAGQGADQGAGQGAGTGAGTGADTGAAPPASWLDPLPAELKGNPALTGFKDVASLAKEHLSLQTLIGKKGVIPPGEKDGPEAWDRFFNQLGRPEKPEGYALKKPEGATDYSEDAAKWFRETAHKAGLTAKQAGLVHDGFVALAGQGAQAQAQARTQARTETETALKQEYGVAYDARLELSRRAMVQFGGEELKAYLEQSGLGNHPALVKAFVKIGALIGEDGLKGGKPAGGGTLSPAEAKAEIAKLQGEAGKDGKHALLDKLHPEHAQMVARLAQLHQMAYPEAA